MAVKRPSLTVDSFLQHLFAPKKNALPTGIRKSKLSFTKTRKRARVAAFNRMSPVSQETLKRAGLRDAYLAGNATLTDARKQLRVQAVAKGYARPLRSKAPVQRVTTDLDRRIAGHIVHTIRESGRFVNIDRVYDQVPYMDPDDKVDADRWPIARIRAYGSDNSKIVTINDKRFNPLWYH